MMSSIFYGEIKEDRLNTWKENKNPYDILADNNRIERLGGWDFLFIADELFTDCVQVDWGSFAYKCTKEQLIELTRKTKCAISGIELLKDGSANLKFLISIYLSGPKVCRSKFGTYSSGRFEKLQVSF